jgi:hypothetical protein
LNFQIFSTLCSPPWNGQARDQTQYILITRPTLYLQIDSMRLVCSKTFVKVIQRWPCIVLRETCEMRTHLGQAKTGLRNVCAKGNSKLRN